MGFCVLWLLILLRECVNVRLYRTVAIGASTTFACGPLHSNPMSCPLHCIVIIKIPPALMLTKCAQQKPTNKPNDNKFYNYVAFV